MLQMSYRQALLIVVIGVVIGEIIGQCIWLLLLYLWRHKRDSLAASFRFSLIAGALLSAFLFVASWLIYGAL
jgi:hypothetical protein